MDGIIIINKPSGCTSHDIVYKIKKITGKKVGHTGTLDPLAQGVLPILIGKATQCSKYLIKHDKIYIAKIQLGIKTDTLDKEGKIIERQDINNNILEEDNIKKALNNMIGKQIQTPPIYSAIKVKGKKLYEYARKGQEVEIPKREIEIYSIELLNIDKKENIIEFKVHCSKGTYIRTLCENIAEKLGTIGYMEDLIRVQVGDFSIDQAIDIQKYDNIELKNEIQKNLIDLKTFFKDKSKIELDDNKLNAFLNGAKIFIKNKEGVYRVFNKNKFIGTGILNDNKLKRDIVV